MMVAQWWTLIEHRRSWVLVYLPPLEPELGWAGLGWAGLGWAGLGWSGLGWAGLGWAE
jgi:hypothetical protein